MIQPWLSSLQSTSKAGLIWTLQQACKATTQLWWEMAHTLDSATLRKMTLSSLIKSRQSRWRFSVNPKHPSRSLAETKPRQALLLTRRLTSFLLRWRWPFTFWSPSFSLSGFSFPVMGSFSPAVTVPLCPWSNKPGCGRFKYFQSQLSLA